MNNKVKICLSVVALLISLCAFPTNYSGEYFWNTDPGVGRATKMAVTNVSADGIMQTTLDASGVAPGMNVLGMRVFNGQWSPTVVQYVFVPQDPTSITEAVCEYWWDSDPGINLGKKLTVSTNDTGTLAVDFNATDLTPGLHMLGFRTGINGMWSPTVTRYVFVPQNPTSITSTTCEYWWDSDPGIGHCENSVTASTNGNGVIDLDLKADGLTPGMHLLGVRSNINGHWSPTVTSPVFVRDNVIAVIDAAEFFWGDDPGYGKGTPIELTAAESITFEHLVFDFPAEKQAEYVLTIRAHSSIGGWGYSMVKVFTPVEATGVTINPSEFRFSYPGEEIDLIAEAIPSNAWINGFEWESSNPNIATVDAEGHVRSVAEGECVITARIKDSEYSAESKITVDNEDRYPLGDSNGSMNVNITDVATTVGYILESDIQKFIFRAADVTEDNEISVADAVGTVDIIFGIPVANANTRAKSMSKANVVHAKISDFNLQTDGTGVLTIELDNSLPLTAMQLDLRLPTDVEIVSASGNWRANEHNCVWKRLDDERYRVILYSSANAPFSGNDGKVLEIELATENSIDSEAVAKAYNIRVVECNSIEYKLPDMEAEASFLSEVKSINSEGLRIFTEGRILHIVSPKRTRVNMSTIEGVVHTLEVKEGDNSYAIKMPGVYIVNDKKIIIH